MNGRFTNFTVLCVACCAIFIVNPSRADDTARLVSQEAYNKVVRNISPFTTEQIKDIRIKFNEINKASNYTGGVPPTPLTSSIVVDLATGATPPVIRLAAGYVTTVVFVDSTGQPWPIKAYDVGNPNHFNIQWNQSTAGEKTGDTMLNTLMIQAMTQYKDGNIAVMLRGMNTPVIFTMVPGQEVVDYRVDVQIPRLGPNAKSQLTFTPSEANPLLLDILNNVPPIKATRQKVTGGDAKAWAMGKSLYIRTPLTVVSPAWISKMAGADGHTNAYELPKASVVLAMDNGRLVRLNIGGK